MLDPVIKWGTLSPLIPSSSAQYVRPWVGLSGLRLTLDLAEVIQLGIETGAYTVDVIRGGPAYKAGIKGGHTNLIYGNMRFPIELTELVA